jgi:hypothetical protein
MVVEQETLRMYPGEPMSERVAVQDTVIPLADGIRTSNGEHITHLPVPKGQIITLGIASYQRLVFSATCLEELTEFA